MNDNSSVPRSVYLRDWCKRFNRQLNLLTVKDYEIFEVWYRKQLTPSMKPTQNPVPRSVNSDKLVTRLVPHWQSIQRNSSTRLLTMFKSYLSKWYWKGLDWKEIILFEELIKKFPSVVIPLFKEKLNLTKVGFQLSLEFQFKGEEDPLMELFGVIQMGEIPDLIYSYQDFIAHWNLSSFQRLRDKIFQIVDFDEHEGKPNIRKPRIRGYRDGKASPRDLLQTRLAQEINNLFYSEKYEKIWSSFYSEIPNLNDLEDYIVAFLKFLQKGNLK